MIEKLIFIYKGQHFFKQKYFFLSTGDHDGYLLGDGGYPCTGYLLTPYSSPANATQERYNRRICRTRVMIEQTFGILKKRFQILDRKMRAKPLRCTKFTTNCVVLHNIGIIRHDIVDIPHVMPAFDPRLDHGAGVVPEGRNVRDHIANTYFQVWSFMTYKMDRTVSICRQLAVSIKVHNRI